MSPQQSQASPAEQQELVARMCKCYDGILNNLQDFDAFSASQIICNVINEHIKRLTTVIRHHNDLAEAAEKSMEALADGLRRLRMQAQQIVDNNHNTVIRLSSEERDPVYSEEG